MADKTPVRVVFNSSNVATGMAEFQSGETVPVANGGTGLSSIGSAGQIIKVNAAGTALEFGAEGDLSITNLVAPTNADLTFSTSGTGNIILDALTVSGTSISSSDSSNININDNAIIDGTLTVSTSLALSSGSTVTGIADEDNMSSNSNTLLATQQSIKAYVDSEVGAVSTTAISQGNSNVTVVDAGTGNVTIEVDGTDRITTVAATTTTATGHSLVIGAGSASAAGQIKFLEGTDNGTNGVTLIGPASTADVTVTLPAATDTLVGKATTDTFTNKTFDVEATGNSISNIDVADLKSGVLDTDISSVSGSDDTIASAKAIKTYVDAQIATKDNSDEITEGSTNLYFTNARADARITNALKDEDNFASDSATHVPSQQSVKAYVDAQDANIAGDTLTFTNKTIDANGTGNNISNIDIGNMTAAVVVLESEGISSNDNDTTLPTSAAVKDYADTKAVLTGSTDNQITTVTGAHAIQGESNLTFDGTTLAVTGAATISTTLGVTGASTLDGITITDNTISTNESNSPLELKANGTGAVKVVSGGVTFTLPTTDGNDGDFLKTDGSGALSFASSTTTASDDTRAVVKNNKSVGSSARTIDYFQATSADAAFYFVALNDLTNDHSSASIFTVAHNNSDAFIGAPRGGASGTANTLPSTTADISSDQVRVKVTAPSGDSKLSYYKIPLSRANTSDATSGVTVTTSNTDVDSASESIDTFAYASFRAAKYVILVDNDSKTETGVVEALVVHNGSDAFIKQYGDVNTGSNQKIVLSAAISGSNVVVSAAGNEPNLSLKIHKTLLSDSMTAVSNSNQKIIGATTVSSSATAFDDFDLDDATAAVYYVVGGNSSEGAFSVQEVYCSGAPGEASVSQGPFVSTKGTTQLNFTAAFKSDADNSLQLSVASTSGGSTTVNAYRINCLAE
jgi:hypothetical protein